MQCARVQDVQCHTTPASILHVRRAEAPDGALNAGAPDVSNTSYRYRLNIADLRPFTFSISLHK